MDKKLEKLKPGTKVLIRKDLELGKRYGNNSVVQSMLVNAGKVVTIKNNLYHHGYLIEEGMFQYTPEMIECVVSPLDQEKFKKLYFVELKDGEKNWWLQNGFKASIGNYVVVENNNGLDVGEVIGVGTFHKDVKFYNLPKKTVGVLNEGEE